MSRVTMICLIALSFNLYAEGWDGAGPSKAPQLKIAKPNPLAGVIPDQPAFLKGEWTEAQTQSLLHGIARAAATRATYSADVFDLTRLRSMRFLLGDEFAVSTEYTQVRNAAAIYGAGISGDDITSFTIPANASGDEIANFLNGKLPPIYVRDEQMLREFQADVAQAQRLSLCESFLSLFR